MRARSTVLWRSRGGVLPRQKPHIAEGPVGGRRPTAAGMERPPAPVCPAWTRGFDAAGDTGLAGANAGVIRRAPCPPISALQPPRRPDLKLPDRPEMCPTLTSQCEPQAAAFAAATRRHASGETPQFNRIFALSYRFATSRLRDAPAAQRARHRASKHTHTDRAVVPQLPDSPSRMGRLECAAVVAPGTPPRPAPPPAKQASGRPDRLTIVRPAAGACIPKLSCHHTRRPSRRRLGRTKRRSSHLTLCAGGIAWARRAARVAV